MINFPSMRIIISNVVSRCHVSLHMSGVEVEIIGKQ